MLINETDANSLEIARGNPEYDKSSVVEIGGISCELRDISMVERLTQKLVRRGWYRCNNERCSNDNHMHRAGQDCEYSHTAKCVECSKPVWERDREYAIAKWGKVVCRQHSPFGHADELFPGEPSPTLSRMHGLAAYYIGKGLSDEQVLEAVTEDMKKWRVEI